MKTQKHFEKKKIVFLAGFMLFVTLISIRKCYYFNVYDGSMKEEEKVLFITVSQNEIETRISKVINESRVKDESKGDAWRKYNSKYLFQKIPIFSSLSHGKYRDHQSLILNNTIADLMKSVQAPKREKAIEIFREYLLREDFSCSMAINDIEQELFLHLIAADY